MKQEAALQGRQGTNRIFGSGEMAGLIRSHHWDRTPLGAIETWPSTLVLTLNTLLATHHPTVLLWSPDHLHFYNDGFRKSMSADKHPFCLGMPGHHCWPEAWEFMTPKIAAVIESGESSWYEHQNQPIHNDGKPRDAWWTYNYSPVRDLDGQIRGILILCQETTPLVLSDRKLKSVLEATTDAVLGVDRNWRINYLNERAITALAPLAQSGDKNGGLAGELMGADIWTTFPLMIHAGSPYEEHYRRAMDHGVPAEFEANYPAPLNFWVHIIVRPVTDGLIIFFRDITQKKREYAALIQSEKLAAIGRMASSIAHEINNPLESLTNLLYLLENLEAGEQRNIFLKQAQGELDRIARITTQTLRFHRQSTHPQPVQLSDVIENVLALIQGRLRHSSVSITTEFRTDRPVYGYEADLRQVFANFISNALDAIDATGPNEGQGAGGRIILRIQEATDPETNATSVRVVIADNGHGMDRTTSERIFEPFFTTRPLTGTGLGLWVSREILEQHGAQVRIRSTDDGAHHGTVFSMRFPATPPASLTNSARSAQLH